MSYRVLVVEDKDLVPDESDEQDEISVVLRERNLRFARLSRSDLHRADLTMADLRGAVLRETRLERARLTEAQLQDADLMVARLAGADLRQARLEGALLAYARLEGAYLGWVGLQSGALPARLQGAELEEANLRGAVLWQARLQGAHLARTQLQGANLISAQLQAADLRQARLQGADLRQAQLQGADLRQAQLQGADLQRAQLQGADLRQAELQGADLNSAGVWLSRSPGNPDQGPAPLGRAQLDKAPTSTAMKAAIAEELQSNSGDPKLLETLRKRLSLILEDDAPKWDEEWPSHDGQTTDPSPASYVPFLLQTACEDAGGYIAAAMADRAERYSMDAARLPYSTPLADALLNESCDGAKALSNEARAELKDLNGSLPQLGTKLDATSAAGLSSGAYMAGQLQLAHSSNIVGVGLVGGGPFACAEAESSMVFPFWPLAVAQNATRAVTSCLQVSGGAPKAPALVARAKELADSSSIDPLDGLADDRVYLFSGNQDEVVMRDVVQAAEAFYQQAGLSGANIAFVKKPGGNAFLTERSVPLYSIAPTKDGGAQTGVAAYFNKVLDKASLLGEADGGSCGVSAPPFVTDCDYGQAKAILEWIYGSSDRPLAEPSTKAQGRFIAFDQRPFAEPEAGLADQGMVYVPASCERQPGCRVHIALHSCDQSREKVGGAFIKEAGFAEMADNNRLVILFPQTKESALNPHGCWDWWGYTGLDYLSKAAPQILAIWSMVEHLAEMPKAQP